jgi:MFS family permease
LSLLAEAILDSIHRPVMQARKLWRVLRTRPGNNAEHNIRMLFLELPPAAVLSAAAAFNAPFALRLGATNEEIGLLSSIPALLAILVLIPSGQILGRRARRMPLVNWSLFIHRMVFLLVALAPLVPGIPHGTAVIWLLIASAPPAHFFGVGWNSMLADVLPENRRARVFAVRSILNGLTVTVGIYLFGVWLDHVAFPINYQVMYMLGWAFSMLSMYYIIRMRVPDSDVPPPAPRQSSSMHALRLYVRDLRAAHPDFLRITANTFLTNITMWMIGPLYILFYVRQLGATEGWIGLNGTLANLTPILGHYLWQRLVWRWGEKNLLKWTVFCIPLYPIAVGLSANLSIILIWTALYALVVPMANMSHFSLLLKICPDAQRPQFLGLFSTVMNIGAFIAPLVGVYLAGIFGFAPVLIVGGVISLFGSASYFVFRLRTPDSLAARQASAG